jgi:hypothetical protein
MLFYMGLNLGLWPKVTSIHGNLPENRVMRITLEVTGGEATGG